MGYQGEKGVQQKAVENQLDIQYIAALDYVCQICKKFVKKGRSHAHPTIGKFKPTFGRDRT